MAPELHQHHRHHPLEQEAAAATPAASSSDESSRRKTQALNPPLVVLEEVPTQRPRKRSRWGERIMTPSLPRLAEQGKTNCEDVSFRWPPVFETCGGQYVLDPKSNLFYDTVSDFFYDCNSKLYYSNQKKMYFRLVVDSPVSGGATRSYFEKVAAWDTTAEENSSSSCVAAPTEEERRMTASGASSTVGVAVDRLRSSCSPRRKSNDNNNKIQICIRTTSMSRRSQSRDRRSQSPRGKSEEANSYLDRKAVKRNRHHQFVDHHQQDAFKFHDRQHQQQQQLHHPHPFSLESVMLQHSRALDMTLLRMNSNHDNNIIASTHGSSRQHVQMLLNMSQNASQELAAASQLQSSEDESTKSVSPPRTTTTTTMTAANGPPICLLCRRKFVSLAQLQRHEEQSELHKTNLLLRLVAK